MTRPAPTLIRLDGRDALDLLHRISTQHLRELAPGHCRTTLFCDFRGRVQHRVAVARTASGAIWLVRDDAPGSGLAAAIDRQIFRDDVRIHDLSTSHRVIVRPAAEAGNAGSVEEHDGLPIVLHLEGGVVAGLDREGESAALDETSRIRLGWPRHGHEIRDDFNAFEVGLARDVHLDKGCFTGQEALLRLMTYQSVRRRLVLLEGTGPPPTIEDAVRLDGVDAGIVTSVAREGDDARVVTSVAREAVAWLALAVVKREVLEPGAGIVTASGSVIARVAPFAEARPLGLPDASTTAG